MTGFRGGMDVAMKLPRAQFERTLEFYRDVLGLHTTEVPDTTVDRSVSVEFGPVTLWLDRVDNYAQAELWLEVFTDDVGRAMKHLADHGIATQDELEPLPGVDGHWISNPAGIPHIVRMED